MGKKLTTEEFIEKARDVHGDRYDYSLTEYKKANEKVIITCREHGNFTQKPNNHVDSKQGCNSCASLIKNESKRLTTEEFIEKARKVHGDKYDYSKVEYVKSISNVIIICKQHGEFEKSPNSHLQAKGCRKCMLEKLGKSRRLETKDFIIKANIVHDNYYTYENTKYVTSNKKVIITCPVHGDFEQKANGHLSGRACVNCFSEKGNFTKTSFKIKSKGRDCSLYIIKCWNEFEEFYKVGITSQGVNKRFCSKFYMPYKYEILYDYKDNAEKVYDLEKTLHKDLKRYSYTPLLKFGGYTECYNTNTPIENHIKNE